MGYLNKQPSALIFDSGSYTSNIDGNVIEFNAVELKSALISVSQAKTIVRTQVQGRDGTVKEFIGMDDYNIRIEGVIAGDNGTIPQTEIDDLKAVLDAPISLDIICPYLNTKGIFQATVLSYELPQVEGGLFFQRYTIDLVSDYPFQLRIASV